MRTLLVDSLPPTISLESKTRKLRIGFAGADALGCRAMNQAVKSHLAEVTAILDESPELAARAARIFPGATVLSSWDELLEVGVDGVVIATPGALNVAQAVSALERGVAFFFQRAPDRLLAQSMELNLARGGAIRPVSSRLFSALQNLRRILNPVEFICGAWPSENSDADSTRAATWIAPFNALVHPDENPFGSS